MNKFWCGALASLCALISITSNADIVNEYWAGPLHIQVVREASGVAPHPEATVDASYNFVVVGSGAQVNWTGYGNLLTGIWPASATSVTARSKDHEWSSPASIDVYGITAQSSDGSPISPSDYIIVEQTSSYVGHPQAFAHLPLGYTLVGGGARVNWQGAGNLLTSSYPSGNSWVASSKDHDIPSLATITAYAIGISNSFLARNRLTVQTRERVSALANHPSATCTLDYGYKILSGGARAEWNGAGSLLTSSYPVDEQSWYASSKDHGTADPAIITTYCIGIK